jgi:hypothetical protein
MASNLISIKGKHKVCWKPLHVSAYGLIEHPRLDAIQLRQIPVQHHLLATDEIDLAGNPLDCYFKGRSTLNALFASQQLSNLALSY